MSSIIPLIILGVVALFGLSGIRIVRPTERAVIETLGKYTRFGSMGFNWIIPIFQSMIQINVTEQMSDIEPQEIITKDNLNATSDLVVFYRVNSDEQSVKNALYNVEDVEGQIKTLARTTARNVIGNMNFTEVNSQRNKLNLILADTMGKETKTWGVQIVRVELKEITPPKSVQETMNRVIQAENEKDAAINFATAKETEADGIKRAKIKEAEGARQYSILKAEGEAKAFDLINQSFKGNAQLLKRLEVTQASLENNSKIVLTEKGIHPSIIMDALPIKSVK
jgi:regulator of protease activity HflC (stomatin/prohibitin superfamily)